MALIVVFLIYGLGVAIYVLATIWVEMNRQD